MISTVLAGFASLLIFWMRRAAHLKAQVEAVEEARRAVLSASRAPLSHA